MAPRLSSWSMRRASAAGAGACLRAGDPRSAVAAPDHRRAALRPAQPPLRSYLWLRPVEQVMLYINIGLRRAITQLDWYTAGNVPEGIISAPDGWNAEQIRSFQEWFDSLLAGNVAERNKVIWTPAGAKYQAFKSSPLEREFEEWLARVICYVFSLPPTALVNQVNRATGETM